VGNTNLTLALTATPDVPVLTYQINGPTGPPYGLAGTPMTITVLDSSLTPSTFTLVSGPASMTIDPGTGLINWAPTLNDAGNTAVHVQATNAAGSTDLTFSFYTCLSPAVTDVTALYHQPVVPSVSWAPPANPAGIAGYTVEAHYTVYTSTVYLTYQAPAGATSVDLTGLTMDNVVIFITVTPTDPQGNRGLSSQQAGFLYNTTVEPDVGWAFNQPAVVAVEPASIQFTDYSGRPSTWSLVSGPAGAAIDPVTGLLTWSPTLADVGHSSLTVHATSGPFSQNFVVPFTVYFTGAAQSPSASRDSNYLYASWLAPTDNPDSIAGYQVTLIWTVNGQTFTATYLTLTTDTTYTIPIPVSDDSVVYQLSVRAVDASGNLGAPGPWFTV
jgi:hypothetical protein